MAEQQKKEYRVILPEALEGGVFANAVSVHFNNNECTIDLAYTLPNAKEPTLKIVSRVNMTHRTAESFLNVLSNALLDWKNKQKEVKA